jgi:PAS domain S-box-containing protein
MNNLQDKLPLMTSLFSMSFSTILLFLVFLIARSSYRDRFSRYWLIGWAFYALRSGFEIAGALRPGLPAVTSGNLISLCGSSIYLFVAATSLIHDSPADRFTSIVFSCAFIVIAASEILGFDKPTMVLVTFLACGGAQIATSVPFFRYRAVSKGFGPPIAAFSIILLGLLNLSYFWVRPNPLLSPIAFQLGTLFRIALGISVAVILFESSREEARRSALRYQALFHSLTDAVLIVDYTGQRLGKFLEVNDQATKYLGYSREELLTMGPEDIEAPETAQRGDFSLQSSTEPALLHRIHVSKRGEKIPVDISAQVFELDGRVVALGLARDVREREASEARLREVIGEKEALLRELHHRVKNNLQIVVSLLSLQEETMSDPSGIDAIEESKTRVASIALVHELLYSDRSVATVDFKSYIVELVKEIGSSRDREGIIEVEVDGHELRYGMDRAVPVGLILVELVTNAYKYAFRGRSRGKIRIAVDRLEGRDMIRVEDDGIGMGDAAPNSKTLGLSLVDILSKQLKGSIELLSSREGTSWRLLIPSVEA